MTSHFIAHYVLQPSRLITNTLIDNIFINSVEYLTHSGNLTIQIADCLFQFALFECFVKDLFPKEVKLYERNFKYFVDREFNVALSKINWDEILLINENDLNIAINNFHQQLSKKSKPWINNLILIEINKRDKIIWTNSEL